MKKLFVFLVVLFPLFSNVLSAAEPKTVAGVSFSAPESWKETEPSSNMRQYQFQIGQDEKAAELAVFYFGQGQGGDIQGNINRWKGQFESISNEETTTKTSSGINITQVVIQGSYQQSSGPMMTPDGKPKANYGMLGAIIEGPEGPVFLKMTGPLDTVNAAKADFEKVLDGVTKA